MEDLEPHPVLTGKKIKGINKTQIIFSLLLISFSVAAANSILVPFFPGEASKRGLNNTLVGIIFAIAYLGSFLSSLVFGKLLFIMGRKKLILIGLIFQTICTIIFGLLIYIDNKVAFTSIAVITRLIMGVSYAAFQSVAYSYIPLIFRTQMEKKMAHMETAFGIGSIAGPIIGSLLYQIQGYQLPFYFFAAIFIIAMVVFIILLPNDNDLLASIKNPEELKKSFSNKRQLELSKFLFSKNFFMTYMVPFIGLQSLGFTWATISLRLEQHYELNPTQTGLVFSISMVSYFISMPIYNRLPKTVDRKYYLSFGMFCSALSLFLMGPNQLILILLKIEEDKTAQLVLTAVGLFIQGLGAAFIYIPVLPQLIIHGTQIYYHRDDSDKVNDMSVGFMNSGVNFSLFFSPVLGGFLTTQYGFKFTCNVFCILIFVYTLCYLLFCQTTKNLKQKSFLSMQENINAEDMKDSLLEP